MTDSDATPRVDPTSIDFENAYKDGTLVEGLVMDRLPWEIGRPQPLLVEFEQAGRITGDVLDIGCGRGDTAIYLAELGYRVTGLDFAPTAIEKARAQAAERGVTVDFAVADATVLDGYDGRFDTVVSSALAHCLDREQRAAHVAALRRVLRPGGRLIQFCFSEVENSESWAPHPITEQELRDSFGAPDWRLTELRADKLTAIKPTPEFLEVMARSGVRPETDAEGCMLLPVWVLEAERV
ncbi:methyltransferase family protein [Nocardia tenerifensis]|uniref:Methyltransferase family protein n=1 Tax=Nocardia tenerifensis TaxID=228006 RepID=A0A318K7V9_9NOCA|nr:class I SAM-dependent methyltransferase [Nocardia tenerifensis]PXX69195.1 methyltransferase family protein [Nocardia tenerifensis]